MVRCSLAPHPQNPVNVVVPLRHNSTKVLSTEVAGAGRVQLGDISTHVKAVNGAHSSPNLLTSAACSLMITCQPHDTLRRRVPYG